MFEGMNFKTVTYAARNAKPMSITVNPNSGKLSLNFTASRMLRSFNKKNMDYEILISGDDAIAIKPVSHGRKMGNRKSIVTICKPVAILVTKPVKVMLYEHDGMLAGYFDNRFEEQ